MRTCANETRISFDSILYFSDSVKNLTCECFRVGEGNQNCQNNLPPTVYHHAYIVGMSLFPGHVLCTWERGCRHEAADNWNRLFLVCNRVALNDGATFRARHQFEFHLMALRH